MLVRVNPKLPALLTQEAAGQAQVPDLDGSQEQVTQPVVMVVETGDHLATGGRQVAVELPLGHAPSVGVLPDGDGSGATGHEPE
jgi:hypothetical protein